MERFLNPALQAFLAQIADELVLAQVLIRRKDGGFELRHIADRFASESKLKPVQCEDARSLAQFTVDGAFRPLKSAPNLQSGWRMCLRNEADLEFALNQLYPGAIADLFAAQSSRPPVTDFRTFIARQTGMYRITQKLSDAQAGDAIRAGCHARFCLKRRLWSVGGLAPDEASTKSLIPCLEPCPLLLEFTRKSMRIEQEKKVDLSITPSDAAVIVHALEHALQNPDASIREADFSRQDNPRRIQLVLEKLKRHFDNQALPPENSDDEG